MESFTSITGIAVPYDFSDVDTDSLIPHRYLRKPVSAGYRNFLFYDARFAPDGTANPEFILHKEPYRRGQILVTGKNFGCGSAREAAVYALYDFGFRAVIAPSYADVFKANCLQRGLLPIELPENAVKTLCAQLEQSPGATVSIDLRTQAVVLPDGTQHNFEIEGSRKIQLLEGLDDIGLTLKHSSVIDEFETRYKATFPWLHPPSSTLLP